MLFSEFLDQDYLRINRLRINYVDLVCSPLDTFVYVLIFVTVVKPIDTLEVIINNYPSDFSRKLIDRLGLIVFKMQHTLPLTPASKQTHKWICMVNDVKAFLSPKRKKIGLQCFHEWAK